MSCVRRLQCHTVVSAIVFAASSRRRPESSDIVHTPTQNGPTVNRVALCLGLWTLRTLRAVRGRRRGQVHKRFVAGEPAEQRRRLGNQPDPSQPGGRLPGYGSGFGQPRIGKRQVPRLGVLIADDRIPILLYNCGLFYKYYYRR